MAEKTIATKIKLAGEKEFNDQMKAVNSGLKTTKSDMAALSAEFSDNADSAQALAAKQKLLQSTVDQQKAKVEALKAQYEKASAVLGENEARTQSYKQQLNQATVALAQATAALEENEKQLKKSKNPITAVVSGYSGLVNKLAEAEERIEKFGEKQEKATKLLARAVSPITGIASGIGTVATGITSGVGKAAAGVAKIAGAATAASAAAGTVALTTMVAFAKDAADAAKEAKESGKRLTDSQKQWLAYSKQLDALDSSVASAKAALGGVLLPVLSDLSSEGATFLNDFARDMEAAAGDTAKQGRIMSDYIVKAAKQIKAKLPEYIKVGKELLSGLGEGFAEEAPELLDMGLDLIMDLLDEIIEFAPELGTAGITLIQKLTESLIERGPDLIASAVEMVSQIVTGLAQAAPDLIPAAVQLISQLITALIENAPQLLLAGLELVYGIISGIADGLGDIIGAADDIIDGIVENFKNSDNEFLQIGGNIVEGIWNGISGATEWIYNKISGWVGSVIDWIKEKLDINSPSGVTEREIGYQMGAGVGVGWTKSMKEVNRMINDSLNTSFDIPEFRANRSASYGRNYTTAAGKTVNLYFYAKTITEADINMVVEIVNRKLGEDL